MRKRLLVITLLPSLAVSDLLAQSASLGLETGVSRTQLATPDNYWGSRTGYLLGASASLSLTPWLAIQAGVRLQEKGAAVPDTFNMRLRYLEFPILARISLGRSEWPVRPLVSLGVAPATELACAEQELPATLTTASSATAMRPSDCASDRTDLWDVGVVAGTGVEVPRVQRLPAGVR
jgi:hypothetical protein